MLPTCGASGGVRRFATPRTTTARPVDLGIIMKILMPLSRLIACLFLLCLSQIAAAQSSYKLNPGDVLQIDVWNEDSLSREALVLPDGYISFPLAGNIKVGGHTSADAADELAKALGKYLKDAPQVTIAIKQLSGNKVYVLGKVNRPGEYPINRPTDVMQALAMAGGLNSFAAENDINILRRNENGKQVAIPFEYGEVKDGDDLKTNILLQSGDVVVVR